MKTKTVEPNLKDIEWLDREFEDVVKSFWSHHSNMERYTDYRNNNVFYAPKAGSIRDQSKLSINLLQVFADKNTHFTGLVPDIIITPTESNGFERDKASKREKVVLGTLADNDMDRKHVRLADDATVRSQGFVHTYWDAKNRSVKIERLDPRYCYYQYANDNDERLVAFWHAFPMTKDQIKRQYGVEPTHSNIDPASFTKQALSRVDGKDWYLVVRRLDDKTSVCWVGDKFIQEPFNHQLGVLPVDMVAPLLTGELDKFPDFYLRPLVSPQAEFNETMRKMANIVRKLGNPAIWGRGIVARQHEDVKRALRGDGGFVGLKGDGELGILQVPETKMLNDHLDQLFKKMQYLAGFSPTAFGDAVGANTSGDAVNMYSQPQLRAIGFQNIAWKALYEAISSKILRYYDTFLGMDEMKTISGYKVKGTFMGVSPSQKASMAKGGFNTMFSKQDIDGNYSVLVSPKSITPKDEIAYKRLIADAVTTGFISKTTGYEEWGMQSPQDELELLVVEQSSGALNPQGELQRAQATSALTQAQGVENGTQGNVQSGQAKAVGNTNTPTNSKASSKAPTK